MKIATWNVERLKHKRDLPQMIEICERISADIFVLTETDSALSLSCKHCFRTLSPFDRTVPYLNTENRVAICTNYEFVGRHETFDGQTALCVELLTDYGNLLVYGVVIGIYGNRHRNFMEDLLLISSDIRRLATDGKNICVCGDFNCSFSDNFYFTQAGRTAFEDMFLSSDLELLTRNHSECIDHIAISRSFLGEHKRKTEEWNCDKKLSDHKGVVVEFLL